VSKVALDPNSIFPNCFFLHGEEQLKNEPRHSCAFYVHLHAPPMHLHDTQALAKAKLQFYLKCNSDICHTSCRLQAELKQFTMEEGVNPFAYTHGWESVWATDVFAFSSSFLSVDGMTCHISF
jgi:hypothetical protein